MWNNFLNFSHLKNYKWSFYLLSDLKWFSKFIFFWWKEPNKIIMLLYTEGYILFLLLFFFSPLIILKKMYWWKFDFKVVSIFNWKIDILFYTMFIRKIKINKLFNELKFFFELNLCNNFLYSFLNINFYYDEINFEIDDSKLIKFKWVLKRKFDDFWEFDDFLVDNDINLKWTNLLLKEIVFSDKLSMQDTSILQNELDKENKMVTLHEDYSDLIELERDSSSNEDDTLDHKDGEFDLNNLIVKEDQLSFIFTNIYKFSFFKKLIWTQYELIVCSLKLYFVNSLTSIPINNLMILNKFYRHIKYLFKVSKSYLIYSIDVIPTDKITETNNYLGKSLNKLLENVFYPTVYMWLFFHKPYWNFWILQKWNLSFYFFFKYLIIYEKNKTIFFGIWIKKYINYLKGGNVEWFFFNLKLNFKLSWILFWGWNNFYIWKNCLNTKFNFPQKFLFLNNLKFFRKIYYFNNFLYCSREIYFFYKNNNFNLFFGKLFWLFFFKRFLFFYKNNNFNLKKNKIIFYFFLNFLYLNNFEYKNLNNMLNPYLNTDLTYYLNFDLFLNLFKFIRNESIGEIKKNFIVNFFLEEEDDKLINFSIVLLFINNIFKILNWLITIKKKITDPNVIFNGDFINFFFYKFFKFARKRWLSYLKINYNLNDIYFSRFYFKNYFFLNINSNFHTLEINLIEIFDLIEMLEIYENFDCFFYLKFFIFNKKKIKLFYYKIFQFIFLKLFLLHWPYWFYLYFDWLREYSNLQLSLDLRELYRTTLLVWYMSKYFFLINKKIFSNVLFFDYQNFYNFEPFYEWFQTYEILFFDECGEDIFDLEFLEDHFYKFILKKYFFKINLTNFINNYFLFQEYFYDVYTFDLNIFFNFKNEELNLNLYLNIKKILDEEIKEYYYYYIFKYFNFQILQFELDLMFKNKINLLICSKDNFFFKLFFLNYFLLFWFY